MKKGTILWMLVICIFAAILIIPYSRGIFLELTGAHPYIMGFIKFAVLATMGELLAIRITESKWNLPQGVLWRALIWGLIGMMITLIFQIYAAGIAGAIAGGYLPGGQNKFAFAFLAGAIINLTFAPTFMAFHRCTDTYLDLVYEGEKNIKLVDVISRVDWNNFISFVVLKTLPIFWIPAHTLTFMLPGEYRVIMAAALSIALGGILSAAKKKKRTVLE